jgi:hypothetical protein
MSLRGFSQRLARIERLDPEDRPRQCIVVWDDDEVAPDIEDRASIMRSGRKAPSVEPWVDIIRVRYSQNG